MSTNEEMETLLDGLAKISTPDEAKAVETKIVGLQGEAMAIAALLRLQESGDFQAWLKRRRSRDEQLMHTIVHADTYDPYNAGLRAGRLQIVIELRSGPDKMRAQLKKITDELQKLQTPEAR